MSTVDNRVDFNGQQDYIRLEIPTDNLTLKENTLKFTNSLMVEEPVSTAMTASVADNDTAIQGLFIQQFEQLAQDPEAFHALMSQVYGKNYDKTAAESLRQRALAGDYSWLPKVQYVDAAEMGNAGGAYDSANNTIYINENLRGTPLAEKVFIEEVGHAIDTQLNSNDTQGDEGELFRRRLGGETLSASEIEAIRTEDDSGKISINGELHEVEFFHISIGGHDFTPPSPSEAVDTVTGAAETGIDVAEEAIGGANDIAEEVAEGTVDVIGNLGEGDVSGAYDSANETGQDVIDTSNDTAVNTAVVVGDDQNNAMNDIFNLGEVSRGLSADEITYLQAIYGDSLDYSEIRVRSGGIQIDVAAHDVGNNIYLPEHYFEENGSLTEKGLEVLGHEAAHAWQYQNDGHGYISEAIGSYDDKDAAYDWETAVREQIPFDDLTPDQQAELAEYIGMAILNSKEGSVTESLYALLSKNGLSRASLDEVMGFTLSDDEFAYIQDVHTHFLNGDATEW